jgi:hypothetical protein
MTFWELNPDEAAEREARLADLNRPISTEVRREKLKHIADAVARESGINQLENQRERERLDDEWKEHRAELMRRRFGAIRAPKKRARN